MRIDKNFLVECKFADIHDDYMVWEEVEEEEDQSDRSAGFDGSCHCRTETEQKCFW